MPELTPEYINAITQEELEAAGYEVRSTYYPGDGDKYVVYVAGEYVVSFHTLDAARLMCRTLYAPRKLLAEFRARNAALEALVREASVAYDAFSRDFSVIMPAAWRERAAKLLGE